MNDPYFKKCHPATITWESIPKEFPDNYNTNKHHYLSDNFDYKMNDYGFRCDNFEQESDIPIVFLGCSVTEGVGMPLESVWAYQLLTKIRNKTNKNIPYWNLSKTGCGIDTQARQLYSFNQIFKAKFIFALFPPFQRREYALEEGEPKTWGSNFALNKEVDRIFVNDYFKYHQTTRSFMIIDSIIKQNNTQMHCSKWKYFEDTEEELFVKNNFQAFNFFPIDVIPTDLSREPRHPGPIYHSLIAHHFWNEINHLF